MGEMIRGENTSYARYEELITRRDNLRKEAFQYHRAYVREFGDLVLDSGKVSGYDTHDNLLRSNAIYREIYTIQNEDGGDLDEPRKNRRQDKNNAHKTKKP